MTFEEEQAKKLHADLERQMKEELQSDKEDQTIPADTLLAVRQKFGLAALPTAKELAQSLKGCKR